MESLGVEEYIRKLKLGLKIVHRDLDIRDVIVKTKRKKVYDRKLNEKKYEIGNKLLIRKEIGNKLQPLYEGPYEVIEINEPNVTILKNGKTNEVHINRTKLF